MPPDPHHRGWDEDPPQYDDGDLFTVAIQHNGFFCGLQEGDLDYASATLDFLDNCSCDTFSLIWIHDILREYGHPINSRLHVYWCHPDKDIREGMQGIDSDKDILDMIAASKEHKTLCVFADHTDFMRIFRPELIINGERGVPAVGYIAASASAGAEEHIARAAVEHVQNASAAEEDIAGEDEHNASLKATHDHSSDSDNDSDFVDSDYDIEDGDDDLYADNIDKEVNGHNEAVEVVEQENDEALDDTDLNLREEDKHMLANRFNVFNLEFRPGMLFSSVEELRFALQSYSVRQRVKVNKLKNDKRRIDAVCKEGCTWFLKATHDSRTGGFTVRSYEGNHTCRRVWELKTLTAPFLTQKFLDEIRDNQKISLKTFAAKVQRQFNMCPDRWKLGRARTEALRIINGDEDAQFSLLWDYGNELRRSNPGSQFFFTTNEVPGAGGEPTKQHLATLYWSYGACKMGFLKGCRPFICIDGCHIKTKDKGQLLTAVAVDPNDCIYPLAMGLVEVECTSSWEWFLTTLKEDLKITNTSPFTIMSDKHKGLINAVQKVWPDAEHIFCVRHLYQNFQKAGHRGEVLKNDLWSIARSPNHAKWEINMEKMKVDSPEAWAWIEELVPNTWIKAFFNEFPKCDLLLNNHCAVFNSYILEAREMPIKSMLDTIFYKLMQRMETKKREALKWPGTICPKIKKKLDKFTEWSLGAFVQLSADGLYHVRTSEIEKEYTVDIKKKTCDCRRWQLSGLPCHHAIACCRFDRIDVDSLVHNCYTIDTYLQAYGQNLVPLRAQAYWQKMNGVHVFPPLYTKVMGRPKKNRKKAPEEKQKRGTTYVTRHGITMHCSVCGQADHNKMGHYKYVQTQQLLEQGVQPGDPQGEEQVQTTEVQDDYDDTTILQRIIPQNPSPAMDPTNVVDSMVYRMREDATVTIDRSTGPIPEESSFVVAARDSIPAARVRVTTASSWARGRGRRTNARGRGDTLIPASTRTATGEGQIPAATRNATGGRGGARKRGTDEASTSGIATVATANARSTRRGRYRTAPGSAYHLLFGNDRQQQPQVIPDLNATPEAPADAEEIQVTQNAPATACCEFECTSYGSTCIFAS